MSDFTIRSNSVEIEQIMRQLRARIREKRGSDHTEEEISEVAGAKLDRFLDPGGVRSDPLEHFRRCAAAPPPPPLDCAFEDTTLSESHRGFVRWTRKLLPPVLKLFFNPIPLTHVLHMQSQINQQHRQWLV